MNSEVLQFTYINEIFVVLWLRSSIPKDILLVFKKKKKKLNEYALNETKRNLGLKLSSFLRNNTAWELQEV